MNVVVPPDILNQPEISVGSMVNVNMEEGISNENGVIQLICAATGIPEPTVQWNREDGKDIILRSESTREKQGKNEFLIILLFIWLQGFFDFAFDWDNGSSGLPLLNGVVLNMEVQIGCLLINFVN